MSAVSQTLADGLEVLKLLHSDRGPLSPGDVAKLLDMERTKAYRLLNTLRESGFAGRLESGAFVPTALTSVWARPPDQVIREAAIEALTELADETDMTCHVSVSHGDVMTAVRVVAPSTVPFHVAYREGSTHAIDRGAAGIVVLAQRGDMAHRGDLADIRAAGYAITNGELETGAVGMAMAIPVVGLEASVGVVTVGDLNVEATAAALARARDQLVAAIGELGLPAPSTP